VPLASGHLLNVGFGRPQSDITKYQVANFCYKDANGVTRVRGTGICIVGQPEAISGDTINTLVYQPNHGGSVENIN